MSHFWGALQISLKAKVAELKKEIKEKKLKLSEPEKQYQKYLEELKKWKKERDQIIGDEQTPDTIKWLKRELKFIKEDIRNEIKKLREERIEKALLIYNKKCELVDIYRHFKDAIDSEISKYKDILGDYEINIDASLKIDPRFYENF